MITIVDYGLGNVLAFENIYKRLNIPVEIVKTSDALSSAKKILLPGVGSFDWAITQLNNSGMRSMLDKLVVEKGIPVIGICVGMQMMAKSSHEGKLDGLGWINAEVKRFDDSNNLQLPHMGWNEIITINNSPLFLGLEEAARFYFLHSYYFSHSEKSQILSQTSYNGLFTSSVNHKNIFGVQFHPEKSHHWGMKLLKNYAEMDTC
ncbi:imidazole glycerol phosphate synthase subunit HisH [Candidatus Pseudothioglobus singularis]|nr:imidazole glycerol phosphate synthase subunit HisH [Candidatus Pseudothioglobus singularis]